MGLQIPILFLHSLLNGFMSTFPDFLLVALVAESDWLKQVW